jgi:hypothetical protein
MADKIMRQMAYDECQHHYPVSGAHLLTGVLKNIPQTEYQYNQRDTKQPSKEYQHRFKVEPVLSKYQEEDNPQEKCREV